MLALILSARANPAIDRYNQGDYDGAVEKFREELKHDPASPAINFNLGDASYRLQKYDEAFEAYAKAMVSSDPTLRQKAYYNGGNALFMQGNNAQDIEQQLSSYYDARYQYHQALDLNPGDEQARKNLSLLEERIKQAEKQKEQEQQRQRTQQRQRPRSNANNSKGQWAKNPINNPKAVREEHNPMTSNRLETNNRTPQIRPKAETKVIRETSPPRALKRTDNFGR